MRLRRSDYAKMLAAQQELTRAEQDYERLRSAYVTLARSEPGHEVALAMVGADMDRAHALLHARIGLLQAQPAPAVVPPAPAAVRPRARERAKESA